MVTTGGRGFSFAPYMVGSAGPSANAEFYFRFTQDGTNWCTTTTSVTNAVVGTTATRPLNLVPPTTVDNVRFGQLYQIAWQGTNSLTISNAPVGCYP